MAPKLGDAVIVFLPSLQEPEWALQKKVGRFTWELHKVERRSPNGGYLGVRRTAVVLGRGKADVAAAFRGCVESHVLNELVTLFVQQHPTYIDETGAPPDSD